MNVYVEEIKEIWRKILLKDEIGENDNFFAMGGNSMTAMQLAAEIEKKYAIELELQDLFENQTIKGLASLIEQKEALNSI